MRRIVLGLVPWLALAPALWALDEVKDPKDKPKAETPDKSKDDKPATAAEQYKALIAEVQKERQAIVKTYREAKTDAEREKILEQYQKAPEKFAGRFLKLA